MDAFFSENLEHYKKYLHFPMRYDIMRVNFYYILIKMPLHTRRSEICSVRCCLIEEIAMCLLSLFKLFPTEGVHSPTVLFLLSCTSLLTQTGAVGTVSEYHDFML